MHEYRYAVNVKSKSTYWDLPANARDVLNPNEIQAVWDAYALSFWSDATEIAQECGYADVRQEGRSGGWLVPVYGAIGRTPHRTTYTISEWLEDCYKSEIPEHDARFERFAKRIRDLQATYEEEFVEELQDRAEVEIARRESLIEAGRGMN